MRLRDKCISQPLLPNELYLYLKTYAAEHDWKISQAGRRIVDRVLNSDIPISIYQDVPEHKTSITNVYLSQDLYGKFIQFARDSQISNNLAFVSILAAFFETDGISVKGG